MISPTILVTNDDGPKAPTGRALIAELAKASWRGELRVAIPAEEQSWIGQAVTRFRPIFTSEHDFEGVPGYLVSGTPADCVGLGLHQLYPDVAELVVSGINLGTNATLPFYLNSGTVGGARQALTFGVRSIGFSALMPENIFAQWREDDHEAMRAHSADWTRLAETCVDLAGRLIAEECWQGVDLYSVNVPWLADRETPVVLTELSRITYKPLYRRRSDGGFEHHLSGFSEPRKSSAHGALPSDLATIQGGQISVTPIRYDLSRFSAEQVGSLTERLNARR
ncbi:MAG: 5'/3'-nucleotidase SurE [Bdellovibrionota bacterium]